MDDEQDFSDFLLASATSYLIDGQEFYEASILLLCKLNTDIGRPFYDGDQSVRNVYIELLGNRVIYEIIQNQKHPATVTIHRAFEAVLSTEYSLEGLRARVVIDNYDANWRAKLLDAIQGKIPLNQGVPIQDKPRYSWEYLFFRSSYEIAIAKALDEYKVLFLPNCMARFSSPNSQERMNKEADFLVCHEGKWGIIEVDGETSHPIAAKDHQRDRLFRSHGIRVIERYTAKQCITNPKGVVREFLELLKKNG